MNFKILKSEVLHRGKVFNTKVDQIEYNSGNRAVREVAEHPGGAVVVGITKDEKIIMVTQHRFPVDKILLELPAGKLDKDENPMHCAIRELEEETGYRAENVKEIGCIYTTPGYSSEKLWIFLAKDLKPGYHNREEGEHGMQVFEFTFKEIEEKIIKGEILDGKTISGIYLAEKILSA
ncbi:MAG: NUDIX hydrolase [Ignavibacteria bacterium]|nr:NUDIX hydrolase [Ignavibacteria bacterium]